MSKALDVIYSLPCRLGLHDWLPMTPSVKRCFRCGKRKLR
jgi:hypothetical protein